MRVFIKLCMHVADRKRISMRITRPKVSECEREEGVRGDKERRSEKSE